MPTSMYAALNGQEIRNIIKNKFGQEVDKIPYLKLGTSFHKAILDFGFTMSAFPADCPVPEKEFQLTLDAETAVNPAAIKQFEKADELVRQITLLEKQEEKIKELLETARETLGTIKLEHEVQFHVDGEIPDKARIENDLPVPVEEIKGGKKVESHLPASFFRKEQTNVS